MQYAICILLLTLLCDVCSRMWSIWGNFMYFLIRSLFGARCDERIHAGADPNSIQVHGHLLTWHIHSSLSDVWKRYESSILISKSNEYTQDWKIGHPEQFSSKILISNIPVSFFPPSACFKMHRIPHPFQSLFSCEKKKIDAINKT